MFYKDMIDNVLKRLNELSKIDYPKYKNGIETKEYLEEMNLINKYNELKDYEKAIDSTYRHNSLIIGMNITGATAIQNRINKTVVYNNNNVKLKIKMLY